MMRIFYAELPEKLNAVESILVGESVPGFPCRETIILIRDALQPTSHNNDNTRILLARAILALPILLSCPKDNDFVECYLKRCITYLSGQIDKSPAFISGYQVIPLPHAIELSSYFDFLHRNGLTFLQIPQQIQKRLPPKITITPPSEPKLSLENTATINPAEIALKGPVSEHATAAEAAIDVVDNENRAILDSPLYMAAQAGDLTTIKKQKKENKLKFLSDAEKALHVAAKLGDTNACRYLLKAGVNVDCRDRNYRTPLRHAAEERHTTVCTLLIEAGSKDRSINVVHLGSLSLCERYFKKKSGLKISTAARLDQKRFFNDEFRSAALFNHLDICQHLWSTYRHLIDVDSQDDDFSGSALSKAAGAGALSVCQFLVNIAKASMVVPPQAFPHAKYAVENGHIETFEYLTQLQSKSQINQRDRSGKTFLHHAIESSSYNLCVLPMVKHLIERPGEQANILATVADQNLWREPRDNIGTSISEGGNTLLHCAIQGVGDNIHIEQYDFSYETCEFLLDNYGTELDINATNTAGWSAFHLAVRVGNLKLCQLFMAHGAQINVRASRAWSPLLIALANTHNQHKEIANLLVENNCSLPRDVMSLNTWLEVDPKHALISILLRHRSFITVFDWLSEMKNTLDIETAPLEVCFSSLFSHLPEILDKNSLTLEDYCNRFDIFEYAISLDQKAVLFIAEWLVKSNAPHYAMRHYMNCINSNLVSDTIRTMSKFYITQLISSGKCVPQLVSTSSILLIFDALGAGGNEDSLSSQNSIDVRSARLILISVVALSADTKSQIANQYAQLIAKFLLVNPQYYNDFIAYWHLAATQGALLRPAGLTRLKVITNNAIKKVKQLAAAAPIAAGLFSQTTQESRQVTDEDAASAAMIFPT